MKWVWPRMKLVSAGLSIFTVLSCMLPPESKQFLPTFEASCLGRAPATLRNFFTPLGLPFYLVTESGSARNLLQVSRCSRQAHDRSSDGSEGGRDFYLSFIPQRRATRQRCLDFCPGFLPSVLLAVFIVRVLPGQAEHERGSRRFQGSPALSRLTFCATQPPASFQRVFP